MHLQLVHKSDISDDLESPFFINFWFQLQVTVPFNI